MNDISRQFFALLSFLVAGSIVALLIGHAQATGQLLSAGLGGFNTLLNTIENPGAGTSSSAFGMNTGNIIGGVGNLASGVGNLVSGVGSIFNPGGGSGGDFGSGITSGSGSGAGFGGGDFSGG